MAHSTASTGSEVEINTCNETNGRWWKVKMAFLMFLLPQKPTCRLKNSGRRRLFGGHVSFPGCIPFRLGKVCVCTASRNLGQPYICLGSLNYRSHSHVVIFNPKKTTIPKIIEFGSADLPPSSWVKLHNYLTHHTPQLSRTGPTSDATNITGSWFTEANHTARFSWPAREAWTFKVMRFYDACRKWMGWRLILREYDMIGFFRFIKTS